MNRQLNAFNTLAGSIDQFCGLRVVEDRLGLTTVPKIKVSPKFEWMTEQGRTGMDAWLLERFGTKQTILIVNPRAAGLNLPEFVLMPKGLKL